MSRIVFPHRPAFFGSLPSRIEYQSQFVLAVVDWLKVVDTCKR
jgi:hypothetical protein